MDNISEEMLEQTLDKKLMSNMRVKKSAHERQANMVSSGEWSSGNGFSNKIFAFSKTPKIHLKTTWISSKVLTFQLFVWLIAVLTAKF